MRFRDGALTDGQVYVTMKLKYNQTYTTQEVKWQIITTFRVTARNKTKAKPLCQRAIVTVWKPQLNTWKTISTSATYSGAFRVCQSDNWQKRACFGKRFVARFPRKTAAQQRQQACNQKCGRTSRSRRFFKPQMLHNRNRFGTEHRITMHKNRISAFGGSNEKTRKHANRRLQLRCRAWLVRKRLVCARDTQKAT